MVLQKKPIVGGYIVDSISTFCTRFIVLFSFRAVSCQVPHGFKFLIMSINQNNKQQIDSITINVNAVCSGVTSLIQTESWWAFLASDGTIKYIKI